MCAVLGFTVCMWRVAAQVSGESPNLYGDGLAIWLITERAQPGPIFGSKGYLNSFKLIAGR